MLGVAAFAAILFFLVMGAMRTSDAFQTASRRAENNRAVNEALGSPISEGWFVFGSVNVMNDSGNADLSIPIKGPKGTGAVHVKGTKQQGVWHYTEMTARLSDGEQVDLSPEPKR